MKTRLERVAVVLILLVVAAATNVGQADDLIPRIKENRPWHLVDSYQTALDQITAELIFLLEKRPVLLIWCFDASESMKDDQHEIKVRLKRVQEELKLSRRLQGDSLLSVVTSYGSQFQLQTPKPTADMADVMKAIDKIHSDRTGVEKMCSAVARCSMLARKWTGDDDAKNKRQPVIIVVTDESGDPSDNQQHLETAVAAAKANDCRVYVLGRQAIFGSPKSHFKWRHPQTRRMHWLPIDRGPETAYPQVFQTDGLGPKRETILSGFAPYEQARLVRETDGIVFMLPAVERALGRKPIAYKLEVMRQYRPDLRARKDVLVDRAKSPLRTVVSQAVQRLNPNDPAVARQITLRRLYSLDPNRLGMQVEQESNKANVYLDQLAAIDKSLAQVADVRRRDMSSRRWHANYDLARAQLAVFQVRVMEYRTALEQLVANPPVAAKTKKPNLALTSWKVGFQKKRSGNAAAEALAREAIKRLEMVIRQHPETPWARAADHELGRGMGIRIEPKYEPPVLRIPKPLPIPRL